MKKTAILLIHCTDRPGIITEISGFIMQNGGNVVYLDQYVDRENRQFFMRIEWEVSGDGLDRQSIKGAVEHLLKGLDPKLELYHSDQPSRIAVFVSKESHCLHDLLYHVTSGSWNAEIPLIIGNHASLSSVADSFGIPFYHIPVSAENKVEAEREQLKLLEEYQVDLVVLARYMQILSAEFVAQAQRKIINIHHSFLPAFAGAKPYHQAYERGVKCIGATSHYVTAELDGGPIIAQDITHVDHRNSVQDLVRKGKELEKVILSRAVWAHVQHKILTYHNKTVVFH